MSLNFLGPSYKAPMASHLPDCLGRDDVLVRTEPSSQMVLPSALMYNMTASPAIVTAMQACVLAFKPSPLLAPLVCFGAALHIELANVYAHGCHYRLPHGRYCCY